MAMGDCPQGIHVSHAKFLPRYRNCYEKEVWLYRDDGDSFIADSGVLCCQCCLPSDPYWHDSGGKPVALLESAFLRAFAGYMLPCVPDEIKRPGVCAIAVPAIAFATCLVLLCHKKVHCASIVLCLSFILWCGTALGYLLYWK